MKVSSKLIGGLVVNANTHGYIASSEHGDSFRGWRKLLPLGRQSLSVGDGGEATMPLAINPWNAIALFQRLLCVYVRVPRSSQSTVAPFTTRMDRCVSCLEPSELLFCPCDGRNRSEITKPSSGERSEIVCCLRPF